MNHGEVIISVWDCRARVARYVEAEPRVYHVEAASNWEDLEDRAAEAVKVAGGWINASGHYPCPSKLAALAAFEGEEE